MANEKNLHPFKPGESGNPLGGKLHNKELRKLRQLTKQEVAELGSLILTKNLDALQAIRNKKNSSVLKVWFASVAVKAISKGDAQALSIILDRIIGKVKDEVSVVSQSTQIHVDPDEVKLMLAKIKSDF